MTQFFAGGLALIIALILWGSKKKSQLLPLLNSQKDYLANTQESSSLVIEKQLNNQQIATRLNNQKLKPFSNKPSLNSLQTKKELNRLISSNPDDRLLAIQIASQWNNVKAIPFLLRGLKDFDRRVVIAAADGISPYRRKTIEITKKTQVSRPPLNVSLMR